MNRPGRPAFSSAAPAAASVAGRWPPAAVFAVLLAATLVIYFPCLAGGLLWDDAGHVTNAELQSWPGLWRIWFEPGATQQYYPLLHSAFWLQHQLWGDATPGYHLVNVFAHATAATLLVSVLRRLAVPGALLAGLLFAMHPVAVESVAWISEQKNTLSTVFYLAAALAWLRFEEERRPVRYAVASVWFLAALLTKSVTATLPAALLVVAWWRRGRLSWRDNVRPLLPWLVGGAGAGLFTVWFERVGIGAQGAAFDLGLIERGLLAGRVVWFYAGKLLWPANLTFFYPRWTIDAAVAWQYLFPVAALVLLAALGWLVRRGGGRGPLAAALLFGGTLFPVLGFVNVYPFVFSYVADHFQYPATLPFFALVAAGFTHACRRGWLGRSAPLVAGGVLVALGVLSWRQSGQYVDSVTLYRATLARNPASWVAHLNLAAELVTRGDPVGALPHARRALELKPDDPEALNTLADVLTRTGRAADALPLLERALQLQPRYAQAENNRGIALLKLGRADEGRRSFQRAIALQPHLAEAHYNLGLAESERGDFTAAIPHFRETLRLRPEHAGAELNWAVALALTNQLAESRPHFARALQLEPRSAVVRQTYGRVLLDAGELEAAVEQWRAAVELDPALPGLHRDLAFALQRLGRTDEARRHAAEAARRP
jgi:tetratricopeptide (TPR) repeat protein